MSAAVRIDQWLWAARLYKTRSLAKQAVNAGHVQLNGVRTKPSRPVNEGDVVSARRGPVKQTVKVTGLATRRGSASVAATLYEETAESVQRREREAEQHRLAALTRTAPTRRPDKRDRRRLARLKEER